MGQHSAKGKPEGLPGGLGGRNRGRQRAAETLSKHGQGQVQPRATGHGPRATGHGPRAQTRVQTRGRATDMETGTGIGTGTGTGMGGDGPQDPDRQGRDPARDDLGMSLGIGAVGVLLF